MIVGRIRLALRSSGCVAYPVRTGQRGRRTSLMHVPQSHTVDSVTEEPETETIYTNPFAAEMDRRKAHLEALPGYRLKVDLEALNRCSYTFSRNAQELSQHVERFLLSHTTSAQELSDDYVNELVRLLHNYLTSVTSLIDAQRVVMRHRWPSAKKGEYSEFETTDYAAQLKETFETGEAEFMQKLRNDCTHYSIPVPGLGTTMSWEAGGPLLRVNTLQLDRDEFAPLGRVASFCDGVSPRPARAI
jgi:hypothetical protein